VRQSDAGEDGVVCDAFYRVGVRRGTEREMAGGEVDFNSSIMKPKKGKGSRGGVILMGEMKEVVQRFISSSIERRTAMSSTAALGAVAQLS
jgi:hypothetical protein